MENLCIDEILRFIRKKNELYFFAEIKHIAQLIKSLEIRKICFVFLDETVKYTNSDDKQSGTIGMIITLVKRETNDVISTHDFWKSVKSFSSILRY